MGVFLHAAMVSLNGKGLLFPGASGTGKSTLAKIFFIRHGAENTLSKLTTLDAANRLMVRCFPTFWHRAGMAFAMDFCARVAAGIECYEFSFVPDQSAVDYIKDFI